MVISAVRAAIRRIALAVLVLAPLMGGAAALAQQSPAETAQTPPPHEVELLLDLLRDPAVQQWLAAQDQVRSEAAASASAPAPVVDTSMPGYFAQRLQVLRDNLALLAAALPLLPDDLRKAWIILSLEFEDKGLWSILLLIAIFAGVGVACVWAYWQLTAGFRNWLIGSEIKSVGDRLRAMAARLTFATGWATSFTPSSAAAGASASSPKSTCIDSTTVLVSAKYTRKALLCVLKPT